MRWRARRGLTSCPCARPSGQSSARRGSLCAKDPPALFDVDESALTAKLAVAAFRQVDYGIPPALALAHLPFTPEGVAQWNKAGDLYGFVADLCHVRTTVVTTEG